MTADPTGDAGSAPTFDVIELRTVRGASDIQVRIWTTPDPALPAPGTIPTAAQFSGGVGAFVGKDCVPDAGQMLPSRARTGRDHPLIW